MKNKKICFFMDNPFSLGGEQRVVTCLANYLSDKCDVSILMTSGAKNNNLYNINENVKIVHVDGYNKFFHRLIRKINKCLLDLNYKTGIYKNNLSKLKKIYGAGLDNKTIINIINKNNYDYVIGVGSYLYSMLGSNMDKINSKVIMWQHSVFEAYFKMNDRRMYNADIFSKYCMENCYKYIVQTKDDKNKIEEYFNIEATIINNPNTFSNNSIAELKKNNFIAAGRFVDIKGFDKLIEAFNIFAKNNNDWNLYIIGSGPEKGKYIKLIKKYGLEKRINLIDYTNNMEMYYKNSKIYLMSSLWEGWGMVVTEAMSFGLPVISFDIPSVREIFGNSECGVIVPKYDIDRYAAAMKKMSSSDLGLISKNCLDRVKLFNIDEIGKQWLALF